jgi:hypothetical protein
MPALRRRTIAAALLLLTFPVRFRGIFRFLLNCRVRGTIPGVMMPLTAVVAGAIPPFDPPLPGAMLAMRDRRLRLGNLRWPITGIPGLRVFCHNYQTDYSGQEP